MRPASSTPLLSIAIATRNRVPYAISAIQGILEISDQRLELVVQDNSDSRELETFVNEEINDTRVRYRYSPSPVSFIENFNAVLELVTGEYICLIGDDDGINPEIMEATQWAKDNGIDTVKPSCGANYLWPGSGISSTVFSEVSQETGFLIIKPFSGTIQYNDNEKELGKLTLKGGQEYLETELPKLYHGIVKRECLDRVREKTGAYFGGLSPDIYASVSIANTAQKSISIEYPLTLPGACRQSGSVESQVGNHTGKLEDAPHFKNRGPYEWAAQVPRYYSVPTIWADSTVAALQDMGRDDLLKDFNMSYLSACCLWAHWEYKKTILSDMYRALRLSNKNLFTGTIRLLFSFVTGPGRLFSRRIKSRLRIIFCGKNFVRLDNIDNIDEAIDALMSYLKKNKQSFAECVRNVKSPPDDGPC